MLELYHLPSSTCSQEVRLAVAEKGLAWTGRVVNLGRFEHLVSALNPNGVVPTRVHDGASVVDCLPPADRAAFRSCIRHGGLGVLGAVFHEHQESWRPHQGIKTPGQDTAAAPVPNPRSARLEVGEIRNSVQAIMP